MHMIIILWQGEGTVKDKGVARAKSVMVLPIFQARSTWYFCLGLRTSRGPMVKVFGLGV